MTVRGQPIRAAADEKALFRSMRENITRGFGGTFDPLEAFLGGPNRGIREAGRSARSSREPAGP